MARFENLVGKKFTRLLVLEKIEKESKKHTSWLCLCDCGKQVSVNGSNLKAKNGIKSCGCLRSELRKQSGKDYAGFKFGRLTILHRDWSKRKDHNPHWECECDCGEKTIVSISNLKKGQIVSCGCFALEKSKERAKNLNTKKDGESALNSVIYSYKYNADIRDLEFNLTNEQVSSLIFAECKYCGAAPSNKSKNRYGNGDVIYNGIDRINNLIGYEKDNCVACCQNCNRAKYKMSYDEFINWIESIYLRHKERVDENNRTGNVGSL